MFNIGGFAGNTARDQTTPQFNLFAPDVSDNFTGKLTRQTFKMICSQWLVYTQHN